MNAEEIAAAQQRWTEEWHEGPLAGAGGEAGDNLAVLVQENHRSNFDLWHEEDKARDPQATSEDICRVKHAIDVLNQKRNDFVERMDEDLLRALSGRGREDAPLHSETAGMMIDRLSILALKVFHTREQAMREDASAEHRAKSAARLHTLEEQRNDLIASLTRMWKEAEDGTRRFKIYRQMKMYNDPEMNPEIYRHGKI